MKLPNGNEARYNLIASAILSKDNGEEVGPGDAVFLPAFTYNATANAVLMTGATPVFVDVDLATHNIDASQIEAAISPKTKAIMPVSLYGQPADMDEINAVAPETPVFILHLYDRALLNAAALRVVDDGEGQAHVAGRLRETDAVRPEGDLLFVRAEP